MTNEEKQLLLQDLCARLPYGVNIKIDGYNISVLKGIDGDTISTDRGINYPLRIIKPYLRPMSSMTEEEKLEIRDLYHQNTQEVFKDPPEIRVYRFYDISVVDWLNKNKFDYRGLIPMGLALPATEGMY